MTELRKLIDQLTTTEEFLNWAASSQPDQILVINGPRGSGKSLLAKGIASTYAKSEVAWIYHLSKVPAKAKLLIVDDVPYSETLTSFLLENSENGANVIYISSCKYDRYSNSNEFIVVDMPNTMMDTVRAEKIDTEIKENKFSMELM